MTPTSKWKSRFKKKFFIESGVIPVEEIMELELFIEAEIEKAKEEVEDKYKDICLDCGYTH